MPRVVADHNIEGHFAVLLRILDATPWREIWAELDLEVTSFEALGLSADASDAELWEACQANDTVLITANRNKDGPESLEATLADKNHGRSLPVLTLSDADQILTSRDYATRVVAQMLEYLFDMDNIRGTGRLYLP